MRVDATYKVRGMAAALKGVGDIMIMNPLEKSIKFEIQKFKKPQNIKEISKTHISFSGAPQKHPFDPEKVVLFVDPYSNNTFYYEFFRKDIGYLEELQNLTNLEGKTIKMVRLWLKKRSIGIRCTPFMVEDVR